MTTAPVPPLDVLPVLAPALPVVVVVVAAVLLVVVAAPPPPLVPLPAVVVATPASAQPPSTKRSANPAPVIDRIAYSIQR
jgi:hypothetical protein